MYNQSNISVKLINPDEVKQFIWRHGRVAEVCYNTPEGNEEKVALHCMKSGHMSGSRGNYLVFEVVGPRYMIDQLVRHEQGVFKNVQSQRYVKPDDLEVYVKKELQLDPRIAYDINIYEYLLKKVNKNLVHTMEENNITGEQRNEILRTILPIGIKSKCVIGFTPEALSHFCAKRLCVRADEPIRILAEKMKYAVLEVEPRFKDLLKVQCEIYGYCVEGKKLCRKPMKDDFDKIIAAGKEALKNKGDK